jgi:hypothetical protein
VLFITAGAQSVTTASKASIRAKEPMLGDLDTEYFDANFVRVDKAEITPCLA